KSAGHWPGTAFAEMSGRATFDETPLPTTGLLDPVAEFLSAQHDHVNEARCWLSAFGHYVPHPSKFPPPNTMIEGEPHILGRVITVGHTALTVVGVTPPH